jgi:hypothetical protein
MLEDVAYFRPQREKVKWKGKCTGLPLKKSTSLMMGVRIEVLNSFTIS